MTKQPDALGAAQDALNRMKRAEKRGTGCRLTKEMIVSLSFMKIGELWTQDDPRDNDKGTPQ